MTALCVFWHPELLLVSTHIVLMEKKKTKKKHPFICCFSKERRDKAVLVINQHSLKHIHIFGGSHGVLGKQEKLLEHFSEKVWYSLLRGIFTSSSWFMNRVMKNLAAKCIICAIWQVGTLEVPPFRGCTGGCKVAACLQWHNTFFGCTLTFQFSLQTSRK